MSEELESVISETPQEDVVDSQETEQAEPIENESSEVVNTPIEEKPVQSAEENANYANIRRQAQQESQKRIDAKYERDYGEQYGIHSEADYDKAIAENERNAQIAEEAQRQGVSEEYARRLRDLEDTNKSTLSEKQEYQRQLALINEDASLKQDESFKEYYTENEKVIKESATSLNVDLTTAMLLHIKDNFKAIKEGTTKKAQQDTINNIIKNKSTSTGSVNGGTGEQSNSIYDMSSADFKAMQDKVMRGEYKK